MTLADESKEPEGSQAPAADQQSVGSAQSRALRIQTIIMQGKGGMTRAELEEYADELEREGLLDDMKDHT